MRGRFLNVALDLKSSRALRPLLHRDIIVMHRKRGFLSIELARQPRTPDDAAREFLSFIGALSGDALAAWAACSDRVFNIGVSAGSEPFQLDITTATQLALTQEGVRIAVTVYPMDPNDRRFEEADAHWEAGRLKQGFELFLLAANDGSVDAFNNVGYAYDVGHGVRRSRSEAIRWYRRALATGDPVAASNLGTMFRKSSPRTARRWFERAVELGLSDALLELAKLDRQPQRAIERLERLLELNDSAPITIEEAESLLATLRGASPAR